MYNTRANWVASWAPRRIYPHQEPSFEDPAAPASAPPARLSLARTNSPPASSSAVSVAPPATGDAPIAPPTAPPPLYFPGAEQIARTRTAHGAPPGMVIVNFTSAPTTLVWASHPTFGKGRRLEHVWGRPAFWWRCLARREGEVLDPEWPQAFGGRARNNADAEDGISRTMSGRSGGSTVADSGVGIGLTPRSTMESQHPLAPLLKQRAETVSRVVAQALVPTRVVLACLELLNVCWVLVLIVALGVERGQQGGFLKGVEVGLVLIIILNGTGVNWVRMKRWTLAKQLRMYSRDWSPLPITSSTNQGLLNNFLGEVDHEALAERQRGKDQPSIRWSMRRYDGSWWLSYRPVVKIELVTPTVAPRPAMLPRPTIDIEAEPEEDGGVPEYVA